MADEKAAAVAARRADAWILAADTVVALDGRVLGKPTDATEAVAMLRRSPAARTRSSPASRCSSPGGAAAERMVVGTPVVFRALTRAEIDAYVATGEPFDRAGAYAIQGEGAHLVDRVEGSYTNVIGLPLPEVAAWLRRWRML